jgi:hypothetical protein
MTPAIHDEIMTPLQYGYTYPTEGLTQVPVVPLTEQIWREYERLWALRPALGKGELAVAQAAFRPWRIHASSGIVDQTRPEGEVHACD